jgi:hypothetical protein
VGNAYLEPCGPYENEIGYSAAHPARWHGLTFQVPESIGQIAAELSARGIMHSGVVVSKFVYVKDQALVGPMRAVSFWECKDDTTGVGLTRIETSLKAVRGGGLGIRSLRMVSLGIRSDDDLGKWSSVLGGMAATRTEDLRLGKGPSVRFVASNENDVNAIEFEVEDLAQAKRHLEKKGILGRSSADGIDIDPTKSYGLRIIFIQKK